MTVKLIDPATSTQIGAAVTDANGDYVFGGFSNTSLGTYTVITPDNESVLINGQDDDVEEKPSVPSTDESSSDIELGQDASVSQIVGLRFNGLPSRRVLRLPVPTSSSALTTTIMSMAGAARLSM